MKALLALMICGSVFVLQSCMSDPNGTDNLKDSMDDNDKMENRRDATDVDRNDTIVHND